MSLKGPDGTKVCRLCDRPWVIHTQQDREDCWSIIQILRAFPGITIIATEDTSDEY